MKNVKLKKIAVTSIFLTLLVLSIYGLISEVEASEPTEPHPANALWTEPSTYEIDNYTAQIGDKFNVTAWVNITESSFMWQTKLFYNTTYFNVTQAGYTAGYISDWATHRTGGGTVPVTPEIDYIAGSVLQGESLMGIEEVPGPLNASLVWVEFELIAIPQQNHLTVNFSVPYGTDTFVWDTYLELITMETIEGTDIPVVPEFPQLILLLVATVTSAASIVLAKKLKR